MMKLRLGQMIQRAKCKKIIRQAEKTWAEMPDETQRLRAAYQKKKADLDRTVQSYEQQLLAEIELRFPIPPAPEKPQ